MALFAKWFYFYHLCVLMGFPIHTDKTSTGSRLYWTNYDVFLSLDVVLILANSADPDEMQHYAAFHQSLHCRQGICLGISSMQRDKGGQWTLRTYHVLLKASTCMCTFTCMSSTLRPLCEEGVLNSMLYVFHIDFW